VVGLITRKDLMPFKMQERLESLLDQTVTLSSDAECVLNSGAAKRSLDSGKGSYYDDKRARSSDALSSRSSCADKSVRTSDAVSTYSDDVTIPAITQTLSTGKLALYGHEEEDEVRSTSSVGSDVEGSVPDLSDTVSLSQIVVTVSPPSDDTPSSEILP